MPDDTPIDAFESSWPTAASAPPRAEHVRIPGYDVIRELHRGGQGVVYEALQRSTKRKVAVKVVLGGMHASKNATKRFEREIELVAQLRHPNIISIFESGVTPEGLHFFAMDYVRGATLDHHVRHRKLSIEETLRLFAIVCDAVQYSHQRGVIHRDLKPSNVIVDTEGTPRVVDFGLAKLLAAPEVTVISVSDRVLGTLAYLSPEQARGNPDEIDTRTDVYSLGVVLYHLLTGQFPYDVRGPFAEVLWNITDAPPTPPTQTWSASSGIKRKSAGSIESQECPIDDDVQTIILKAIAKERDRRYQSAGELAGDIRSYLKGDAISAKRDSSWYVLRKTLYRYRATLAIAAALAFMVIAAAGISTISWRQASAERDLARAALYFNTISQAEYAREHYDFGRMRRLLDECPPDQRNWEWYHVDNRIQRNATTVFTGLNDISWLAISPDESSFLTISGTRGFVNAAGEARIWNANGSLRKVLPFRMAQSVRGFIDSNQLEARDVNRSNSSALRLVDIDTGEWTFPCAVEIGLRASFAALWPNRLVCGNLDGVSVQDPRTRNELLSVVAAADAPILSYAFNPAQDLLAIGDGKGDIRLHYLSGKGDRLIAAYANGVRDLVFSHSGARLISFSGDVVKVHDSRTGEEVYSTERAAAIATQGPFTPSSSIRMSEDGAGLVYLTESDVAVVGIKQGTFATLGVDPPSLIAFAARPEGDLFATVDKDRIIQIADASGNELRHFQAWNKGSSLPGLRRMDFIDGRLLFYDDDRWSVWDATTGANLLTVKGIATCPDESSWISADSEVLSVWEPTTGLHIMSFAGHTKPVTAAACSPTGRTIASADELGTVHLWSTSPTDGSYILRGHVGAVNCVAFAPGSDWLLTGGADKSIKVWRTSDKDYKKTLNLEAPVTHLAVSTSRLYVASEDGLVVRSLNSPEEKGARLAAHPTSNNSLAILDDGTVLTSCADQVVKIWEVSGREIGALNYAAAAITSRPRTHQVATSSLHGTTVVAWDTDSRMQLFSVSTPAAVRRLVYSADGALLFGACEEGTIVVWNAESGDVLRSWKGQQKDPTALAITRDGSRLFIASLDGSIQISDAKSGRDILRLSGHAGSVNGIALNEDDSVLASVGSDGTVRLWSAKRER